MFSTRAGTKLSFSAWRSARSLRSAASIASGVVSCSLQTASVVAIRLRRQLWPGRSRPSASAGPCEPASYWGSGPDTSLQALMIGSQMRHWDSTSSFLVNRVASPRIASVINRS